MSETLGDRLRRQRERKQIALRTISEETKINVALLEALERDDVSRWPNGIFRRAFVRAYARAVGLDCDTVVQEFLAVHPDRAEPPPPPAPIADTSEVRTTDDGAGGLGRRVATTLRALAGDRREAEAVELGRLTVSATPAAADAAVEHTPAFELDLQAAASLCTRLAQAGKLSEPQTALEDIVRILGARGVIVWRWCPETSQLIPAASYGYPQKLLAQLGGVAREADNATAGAFRSGAPSIVPGSESSNGAIAAPSMGPDGAAGVLAIELPSGRERHPSIQAIVAIWAASLARILAHDTAADLAEHRRAV